MLKSISPETSMQIHLNFLRTDTFCHFRTCCISCLWCFYRFKVIGYHSAWIYLESDVSYKRYTRWDTMKNIKNKFPIQWKLIRTILNSFSSNVCGHFHLPNWYLRNNDLELYRSLYHAGMNLNGLNFFFFFQLHIIHFQISIGLTEKYKYLNNEIMQKIKKHQYTVDWRFFREKYSTLDDLVKETDKCISPLIVVSFTGNVYFITLQFCNSLMCESMSIFILYNNHKKLMIFL